MEKTAVEWFHDELRKFANGESNLTGKEILEQAIVMEKQEIIKAYLKGESNGCGCYDYATKEDAEEYYNQTYDK